MTKTYKKSSKRDIDVRPDDSSIKERSSKRRRRIVANRASGFEEAEKWDLEFWQSQTPQQRLSALAAIRRDVIKVEQGRSRTRRVKEDKP